METQRNLKRHDGRREPRRCRACGQRFTGDAAFCPFDGTRLEAADSIPLSDPMIGLTIDARYEILALLGEGGMGQVYEARHLALDRHFAIKVLRRDLAQDDELASRFIQEARATASVRHPNVVEITDFGRLDDRAGGAPYFAMELLVGETLGHIIKAGGPIPAGRAVRIIKQVAGALAAAHGCGIVHRDLKPDNVFLVGGVAGGAASEDVRVVDFGAAKIIGASRVTRQGIVFGTPHYMSPEQASGQPVDHRADIYALGVIMYEMFTGRVPFEADTYMGVLTQHMFVQPAPPSQLCTPACELGVLEEITMVCLAKKPEQRYASMTALSSALDEVVHSRGDGRVQVASHVPAHSSGGPSRMGYRMADELEPSTLAEMRVAVDSVPPPKRAVPWGWILGLGGVLVAVAVLWALMDRAAPPPTPPASAATPPSATVPASAGAPTSVVPTAFSSAAASATEAAAPSSATPAAPATAHRPSKTQPPRGMDDIGDPFARKR